MCPWRAGSHLHPSISWCQSDEVVMTLVTMSVYMPPQVMRRTSLVIRLSRHGYTVGLLNHVSAPEPQLLPEALIVNDVTIIG